MAGQFHDFNLTIDRGTLEESGFMSKRALQDFPKSFCSLIASHTQGIGITEFPEYVYSLAISTRRRVVKVDFYRENAVLAQLKLMSESLSDTWIPSVGEWFLIYGDENYKPRFSCYVKESRVVSSSILEKEINKLKLIDHFDITIKNSDKFEVSINNDESIELNGQSLIEMYLRKSLITQGQPQWKGINKSSSSHYHLLQQKMNLLGGVTDIDLLKINRGKKNSFIELKRSYIDPEKWLPFKADAGGYKLLSEFAKINDGDVLVAYWKRQTNPWHEDLNKIKILRYEQEGFRFIEYLNFKDFVNKYLLD